MRPASPRPISDARLFVPRGTFDAGQAALIAGQMRAVRSRRFVTLDLHEVREVHDDALVLVARELQGRHGAVIGLSEHHVRLLRYLGLTLQPVLPGPRRSTPAEASGRGTSPLDARGARWARYCATFVARPPEPCAAHAARSWTPRVSRRARPT